MMRPTTAFRLAATACLFATFVRAGAAEGLSGLLPTTVPQKIVETVDVLPEGSRGEVTEALNALYGPDELSVAEQRSALNTLRDAVATAKSNTGDVRAIEFAGRLGRRVAVWDAALGTDTEDTPAFAAVDALDTLGSRLAAIPGGEAWLPYVGADELRDALGTLAAGDDADRGPLDAALARLSPEAVEDAEQREFLGKPAFRDLAAALEAVIADLESAGSTEEAADGPFRDALGDLLGAIENAERDGGFENRLALREAVETLRQAPGGGTIAARAGGLYFGKANVVASASERFLNRLVARTDTTSGPVSDFFNGSRIRGTSTTTSTTGLDLRPSRDSVAFAITLSGTTLSQTTAYSSRATIGTAGRHTFRGSYDLAVRDGRVYFGSPRLDVTPNLRTTSIRTSVGGIFAGIARQRAAEAVAQSRPASLARARRRVTERVLPAFESGVRDRFGSVNRTLGSRGGASSRFAKEGLDLVTTEQRTTSDRAFYSARVGLADAEIAGATPVPPIACPSDGAFAAVHAFAIDAVCDRLGLAGETKTLDEAGEIARDVIERLLGRSLSARAPRNDAAGDEENVALIFADEHPVSVRIADGGLDLVLRVGLKREGKDDVPPQTVTVPFEVGFEGGEIVFTPGGVIVAPYGEVASRARQITRSAAIRTRFNDRLEPIRVDRTVELAGTTVRVAELTLADGWAIAEFAAPATRRVSGSEGPTRVIRPSAPRRVIRYRSAR